MITRHIFYNTECAKAAAEIWEHGNTDTAKSASDKQTGCKHAKSWARLSKPHYLELKPKMRASEMSVITRLWTEKLHTLKIWSKVKVEPGSLSVNCDVCSQEIVWVIILPFSLVFSFKSICLTLGFVCLIVFLDRSELFIVMLPRSPNLISSIWSAKWCRCPSLT